jgi:hypothetical protein
VPQTAVSLSYCHSIGDPHYATFDGIKYDFHGIGSYYLLKLPNLIVQSRQAPCMPGAKHIVCNNAMSVSYGSSEVSAAVANDGSISVYDLTKSQGFDNDEIHTIISPNKVKNKIYSRDQIKQITNNLQSLV